MNVSLMTEMFMPEHNTGYRFSIEKFLIGKVPFLSILNETISCHEEHFSYIKIRGIVTLLALKQSHLYSETLLIQVVEKP